MIDDEKIIEMFFGRSEQGIRELDIKYGKVCHNLSYHIVGSRQDAEECVNDAYLSACQAADTRRTKLTLQAGTTRTTPSCGARHGLTIPTTFWRGTEARSVSTTAATPSAALTRYPPSTWAWRLARWRRKASPPRKAN